MGARPLAPYTPTSTYKRLFSPDGFDFNLMMEDQQSSPQYPDDEERVLPDTVRVDTAPSDDGGSAITTTSRRRRTCTARHC